MMVLYHLVYDLDSFGGYAIGSTSGLWGLFANVTAATFAFLVGLSLSISFSGDREDGEGRGTVRRHYRRYLLRGGKVFLCGMLITVAFWAFGVGTVVFGILHLIGLSIVLAYPFRDLGPFNAVLGVLFTVAGAYVGAQDPSIQGPWLAWAGVDPAGIYMPDYRPLLPWFGVVLLGLYAGDVLYRGRSPVEPRWPPARPLAFLGRHSLLIYLVHQPLLILTLWLSGVIELGF